MKNKGCVLAVIIYLVGCYFSYLANKKCIIDIHQRINGKYEYTISDRRFCLTFTPLSWIGVIAANLYIYMKSPDNENPANW